MKLFRFAPGIFLTLLFSGRGWSGGRGRYLSGLAAALSLVWNLGSLIVLVFPRLNTLPFDQLEPSREIAGRRAAVLRRLTKAKKPIFLVSTAEAVMERLTAAARDGKRVVRLHSGDTSLYSAIQEQMTLLDEAGIDHVELQHGTNRGQFRGRLRHRCAEVFQTCRGLGAQQIDLGEHFRGCAHGDETRADRLAGSGGRAPALRGPVA